MMLDAQTFEEFRGCENKEICKFVPLTAPRLRLHLVLILGPQCMQLSYFLTNPMQLAMISLYCRNFSTS